MDFSEPRNPVKPHLIEPLQELIGRSKLQMLYGAAFVWLAPDTQWAIFRLIRDAQTSNVPAVVSLRAKFQRQRRVTAPLKQKIAELVGELDEEAWRLQEKADEYAQLKAKVGRQFEELIQLRRQVETLKQEQQRVQRKVRAFEDDQGERTLRELQDDLWRAVRECLDGVQKSVDSPQQIRMNFVPVHRELTKLLHRVQSLRKSRASRQTLDPSR